MELTCLMPTTAKRSSGSRWRSWFWQWQKPYPRLEAVLYRLPKPMANALALPVMRCLVFAVGGLAEKCLSSRIWCEVSVVLKSIVLRCSGSNTRFKKHFPNVKSGVEVDESGDLWVSVIVEESVEWSVFFAQEAEPCPGV